MYLGIIGIEVCGGCGGLDFDLYIGIVVFIEMVVQVLLYVFLYCVDYEVQLEYCLCLCWNCFYWMLCIVGFEGDQFQCILGEQVFVGIQVGFVLLCIEYWIIVVVVYCKVVYQGMYLFVYVVWMYIWYVDYVVFIYQ